MTQGDDGIYAHRAARRNVTGREVGDSGMLTSVKNAGKSVEKRNEIGLCAECVHSRQIRSDRGSLFYFCALSETDASFPKYPRLPVLACSGYVKKTI